jgi:hypothetical protein
MSTLHPHSWSELPAEILWYLVPMSLLHLALFALGCVVLALVATKQRGTFRRRAGRLGLFLGLLLIVGAIFNGVWSCSVWGRLYYSADYVFDFSPFWPITERVLNVTFGEARGRLLGVSLFQLQLVWLVFAVSTWTITILSYRLIRQRSR